MNTPSAGLTRWCLQNLQLFKDYLDLAESQDAGDLLARAVRDFLNASTPEEIRWATNRTHPLLFLSFPLESDYGQFFNGE
jgi:hypothetical protein